MLCCGKLLCQGHPDCNVYSSHVPDPNVNALCISRFYIFLSLQRKNLVYLGGSYFIWTQCRLNKCCKWVSGRKGKESIEWITGSIDEEEAILWHEIGKEFKEIMIFLCKIIRETWATYLLVSSLLNLQLLNYYI